MMNSTPHWATKRSLILPMAAEMSPLGIRPVWVLHPETKMSPLELWRVRVSHREPATYLLAQLKDQLLPKRTATLTLAILTSPRCPWVVILTLLRLI